MVTLSIDLGKDPVDTIMDMHQLCETPRGATITSVLLHTKTGSVSDGTLSQIISSVRGLANLRILSFDLNFKMQLSTNSLADFSHFSALRELRLKRLRLIGSTGKILTMSPHIQYLKLDNCHDEDDKIEALIGMLRGLKTVKLVKTPIMSADSTALADLCRSTTLQSLVLHRVPNLSDCHIFMIASELSRESCQLQELYISSESLSDPAAMVLQEMLKSNQSIRHLVLHLDCETPMDLTEVYECRPEFKGVDVRTMSEVVAQHQEEEAHRAAEGSAEEDATEHSRVSSSESDHSYRRHSPLANLFRNKFFKMPSKSKLPKIPMA